MKGKNLYLSCFIAGAIAISCGNNNNTDNTSEEENEVAEQTSNPVEALGGLSKIEEHVKQMEERVKELKKLTPVSHDVLKSVLPENFEGLKRKSLNIGDLSTMGLVQAEVSYKNEDDSKEVDIHIIDGAGEAGSSLVSILLVGLKANKEEILENGFEKSTEIDGTRAIVKEENTNDEKNSSIQTVYADRFLVTVNGKGYSLDELTALYKKINLSKLK